MSRKIRVAVIFGGRSAEHEVSLQSAKNVIQSLDREKYDPLLIGIDRQGRWYLNQDSIHLLNSENPALIQLNNQGDTEVALTPTGSSTKLISMNDGSDGFGEIDVIFPVLHGPYGEDGSIQGLAKMADLPCVGAGIAGSAVGMDKDIMKRLLRDSGLPIGDFISCFRRQKNSLSFSEVSERLGLPLYIKPANMGSSVGISRVNTETEFKEALDLAFRYDTKVLIEANISGREIECAVLGNDHPKASIIGEIIPTDGFYSYKAKYISDTGALLNIPAELDEQTMKQAQKVAVEAYEVLSCRGLGRVDMFLKEDGTILINEINTLPGFTRISMYPKLWEYSGLPCTKLVDELIRLAIEDFEDLHDLDSTV